MYHFAIKMIFFDKLVVFSLLERKEKISLPTSIKGLIISHFTDKTVYFEQILGKININANRKSFESHITESIASFL